jgi:hypothetical protein
MVLETCTSNDDGLYLLRGLWPGLQYSVKVEARGHRNAEAAQITGEPGGTKDTGSIVLINTSSRLAGRVVGADGRPVAGAAVFNRGDCPESSACTTDAQGQFRLDGLFAGAKYAFVRKEGYRFTGIKVDHGASDLTITLLKATEACPRWAPDATPSWNEQRAFAKRMLVRIWEKFGADADNNGAQACAWNMALFDVDRALEWSARLGHRYDRRVRQTAAKERAETDAEGARWRWSRTTRIGALPGH